MGKLKKPSLKIGNKESQKLKTKSKIKKKSSHAIPLAKIHKKLITKKDKKKLKKQKVLDGILTTKKKFAEDRARKKREQTEIVGDMRPLLDSLPSLDELITIREKSKRTGISAIDNRIPKKPKNKFEKKKILTSIKTEKYLDRFDHLQKVWKDENFKKNPRELIAQQIKQRRAMMNNNNS
jgi:hypothetical protein